MADTIGLYYKTGGAETGGANSLTGLLTGGTRISTGDTEATPFAFAALDTVYTLYYKAEDDATFEDAGKDTSAAFTITAPTGVQVCDTHNGTFASSVSVPAAVGAYKPVFAKQTARQASPEADLEVGTGGVTFVTGTRVAQVGTVTLTPAGDGQISAAWDAVTDADGYIVQYKTTAGSTWSNAADVTSPSVITGLSPSTSYDVRVRAYSDLGAGAWSATATASTYLFFDGFDRADSSTVGNSWTQTVLLGTGGNPVEYGVKSNTLYVRSATADQGNICLTRATSAGSNRTVSVKVNKYQTYVYLGRSASNPQNADTGSLTYSGNGYVLIANPSSGLFLLRKFTNGSPTNLTSVNHSTTAGDVISVRRVGNDIKTYINGVEKHSVTDSTYLTLGYVGVLVSCAGNDDNSADDFSVAE